MTIRHRLKDFARWRQVFNEHAGVREAFGLNGGVLIPNAVDPGEAIAHQLNESITFQRLNGSVGQ